MSSLALSGIISAIATPFDSNQKLKESVTNELMDMQMAGGVHGFYICGGMGEGLALPKSIRMQMAEVAVSKAKGKCKIINHIGAANIEETLELTRHSEEIGVDAVASLAPSHFYAYCEDEIFKYYKIIADNTSLPVIVYATSLFCGVDVVRLSKKLMKIPNVIGMKFTMNDYHVFRQLKEIEGSLIFDGQDNTLICGLVMGADGGIGASYNIMAAWFCQLYDSYRKGDINEAQNLQYKINRVIKVLIDFGGMKAIKPVLEMMGFDVGSYVFPGKSLSQEHLKILKKKVIACGLQI
ncbi:MAG: hypothetical protein HN948_03555 [Clostridia bacterium]|jgi:N-acetylneuraminate lyase|nr:hypothetical protein [Clostridia bacterium]MBT7122069.1 hypothetical protein [Clostridia bacterium]